MKKWKFSYAYIDGVLYMPLTEVVRLLREMQQDALAETILQANKDILQEKEQK